MGLKLGLQLWNQVFSWPEARDAAVRAEALGYDSLWTWEHALACMGPPDQDTFDAYTLLTAWRRERGRALQRGAELMRLLHTNGVGISGRRGQSGE